MNLVFKLWNGSAHFWVNQPIELILMDFLYFCTQLAYYNQTFNPNFQARRLVLLMKYQKFDLNWFWPNPKILYLNLFPFVVQCSGASWFCYTWIHNPWQLGTHVWRLDSLDMNNNIGITKRFVTNIFKKDLKWHVQSRLKPNPILLKS